MGQAFLLASILLSPPPAFYHELNRITVTHGNGAVVQRTEVRVFDARTKKQIWLRRFDGWTAIGWSADQRAIAIAEPLHLTIWIHGQKVRRLPIPVRAETPGVGAYQNGVVWSPDRTHIALRVPSSMAETEENLGRALCIEARTGKSILVAEDVRAMTWSDSQTLSLTVGNEDAPEIHLWSLLQKPYFQNISPPKSRYSQ